MEKQFCIHCGKKQEYRVDSRQDTVDIRGIAVQWGYRDMTDGSTYPLAANPAELKALLLG